MATTNTLEFLITAKDEASKKLGGIADIAQKLGAGFTVAGAAITGALAMTVKAAADAEEQMAQFDTTLKNSKGATDAIRASILKASDATLKLGFDNEDTANSIAKFFQRTKDATQAIKLNNIAMDLARAKNIDLATASKAVSMVLSGNGKVLKEYGIEISETMSPLEALDELHKKVGGSATAFAQTFKGQMEVFGQSTSELKESIGAVLLPLLTQLVEKLIPIIDKVKAWTDANPELTQRIVIITAAIGGLMVVLGPLLLALPMIVAGFTLLLGPIGLVISIIGALTFAIMQVVKVMDLLQKDSATIWEGIKIIFKEAVDAIIGYFQPLIDIMNIIIDKATRIGSSISSAVGRGFNAVGNFITGKAGGGQVSGGTTYLVGEQGPELFTPGSSGAITPNFALGGASTKNININISGAVFTKEAARQLGDTILANFKLMSRTAL